MLEESPLVKASKPYLEPFLRFGLVGTPPRVADPIISQLGSKQFDQLTSSAAAEVLEGLAYLQWIRAALVAGPVLGILVGLTSIKGRYTEMLWAIGLVLIMWLPLYMILLGLVRFFLLHPDRMAAARISSRPVAWRAARYSPSISLLLAGVFGALFH